MPLYVSEIFKLVEAAKTRKEKIDIMRQHGTPLLQTILYHAFAPEIKFALKEIPPYKENKVPSPEMGDTNLQMVMAKIYLFINAPTKNAKANPIPDTKRRELLIRALENLQWEEANVLVGMLSKKFKSKAIDERLVWESFPGLLPRREE